MKADADDQQRLERRLRSFAARHASHHAPLALVTSGGTAADLEHNCVRFLDNFSTGTRGAHAVEELCRRGYAVVHLKREGSVSPFGRVLANAIKCGKGGGGPTFDSFGAMFDCGGGSDDDCDGDGGDFGLQDVDDEEEDEKAKISGGKRAVDPWMYSGNDDQKDDSDAGYNPGSGRSRQRKQRGMELSLNPRLAGSPLLQSNLRAYKRIKRQGLLLTITFRTVDDYIRKLQLCSEAVSICGSLTLVYLAAAVSDFYVPDERKALHKIQSRDYGIRSQASSSLDSASSRGDEGAAAPETTMQVQSDNTLTLTLYPVPKVIPKLRREWCPDAFVVSFKLETDPSILRQKSVLAMERNAVHMVIGNELATRYEKVFILTRKDGDFYDDDDDDDVDFGEQGGNGSTDAADSSYQLPAGYHIAEVTAAHGYGMSSSLALGNGAEGGGADALEYATIEYVARRHFHYISTHVGEGAVVPNLSRSEAPPASAAELASRHTLNAASLHRKRLDEQHRQLQRERLKLRLAELAWNVAGSALGMALSYGIARMLQGRQRQGMV